MTYQRRVLFSAFYQFIIQIFKDAMLIMICIAPVLCGLFFRFGIPFIQSLLTTYLNMPNLLKQYYLLFDLFLGTITPILYSFAAAFVILGEIDDGLSKYLAVTPVGKNGYLISRLGFPAVIAFVVSIVTLSVFKLTNVSIVVIVGISLISSLLGIIQALIIVSLSGNKVEGMAVAKLSGLFFLGLPVPFFINGNIQYALFIIPSFWLAKYAMEEKVLLAIVAVLTSLVWIIILQKRFIKKIR